MPRSQKKCPLCAEEIPLTAITCEYCGVVFKVTSTGYCQNCHQVRETDGNGRCKICGDKLMDLRVESKLIKDAAQEPLPASPQVAKTEVTPIRKSCLSISILAGILILAIIGAVLWLGWNSTSLIAPMPTTTFTPTSTSTATLAPTATPTRTLRPTPTTTPIPSWVTEYVEPVLAAIANKRPFFQDDFSQESVSWRFVDSNSQDKVEIKDGALVATIRSGGREVQIFHSQHPALRFKNFALRVDVDLSKLGSGDAADIHWRGKDCDGVGFRLWKDGRWEVYAEGPFMQLATGYQLIDSTQEVTITIISKDAEYAIYIDETLVSYINDSGRTPGIGICICVFDDIGSSTVVTFDNLKMWDLDKIQIQP